MNNILKHRARITIVLTVITATIVAITSFLQYKVAKLDSDVFEKTLGKDIEVSTIIANESKAIFNALFLLQKCETSSPGFGTETYNEEMCQSLGKDFNDILPIIRESENEYLPQKNAALDDSIETREDKIEVYGICLLILYLIFFILSCLIILLNVYPIAIEKRS